MGLGAGAAGGLTGATAETGGVGGAASADFPATAGGAGGGGLGGLIQQFLSKPENTKSISEMVNHVSSIQGTLGKNPEMAQMFQHLVMNAPQGGASAGKGRLDTSGPYLGDINSYRIDPEVAQAVLGHLGIST